MDENSCCLTASGPVGLLSTVCCRTMSGVLDAVAGDFPPVVRLETTNACNARCIICPHRDMRRPIVTMSSELYTRLIDGGVPPRAAAKCTCTISASRSWTSTWRIGSRMRKRRASAG